MRARSFTGALLALLLVAGAAAPAQAYVGPGAGFAFLGSFAMLLVAFGAAAFSLATWPARWLLRRWRRRRALADARVRRMIVLGLDGLDPELVDRWMAEGHLPNLEKLAERGSYQRLGTTYPSISPVAWSSFMTGVGPASHNIFDFITRDPRTYAPTLSSSEIHGPRRSLRVGNWVIPLGRPLVRSLRRSRAFWSILGEHGIPCQILRVPLTFPAEKFAGALLSAMCVPDLRGTQGAFTFYTTDPAQLGGMEPGLETNGGERERLVLEGENASAILHGPENFLRPAGEPIALPFSLRRDLARRRVRLRIDGQTHWLREGEYSPWIRLRFRAGPGVKVQGIARFYVTSLEPHLSLYVTPINIDPARPALPISFPSWYSLYLQKLIGDFATLGLAEDTWALNERVIDEDAFLRQVWDLHAEREAMFFSALEKARDGVVACVFDGTDRLQHMFFRYLEDDHPATRGTDVSKYRDSILDMYRRVDQIVGRVLARLGPDEHFIVLSDHGFKSFRRGVNLNTWLRDRGLLVLRDDADPEGSWLEGVDWGRTRAYAMGLGGIYINTRGRESQGIIEPGQELRELSRKIAEELGGLRDEACDSIAINRVYESGDVYGGGPYAANGPDLVVGYNAGYRASWEGAVGRLTEEVFNDNTKCWSGDHCIDPALVPGVLFSSRPIASSDASITDLAPTILTQFGVEVPEHMTGRALEVQDDRGAG
jgi:predicted AlkP superfamily phosphohydrolase/phosphomutase